MPTMRPERSSESDRQGLWSRARRSLPGSAPPRRTDPRCCRTLLTSSTPCFGSWRILLDGNGLLVYLVKNLAVLVKFFRLFEVPRPRVRFHIDHGRVVIILKIKNGERAGMHGCVCSNVPRNHPNLN